MPFVLNNLCDMFLFSLTGLFFLSGHEAFLCAQQVVTCSIFIFVNVCSAWLPFLVATTVRTEPLFLTLKRTVRYRTSGLESGEL